ncbi:MAG: TraB/GumN family protein [Ignavibacteriales bacterium]|nr:TraB/GumN family protein [Ignavibacteriales bacterium]
MINRNRDWAKKIEELSKNKKKYLVVVGAGHLVGEELITVFEESKGLNEEDITCSWSEAKLHEGGAGI